MTYTEVYEDYLSPYYPLEYSGTSLSIDDLISNWSWDTPTALPTMYVQRSVPQVVEPRIETRPYKQFLGNKFRLGGSKK